MNIYLTFDYELFFGEQSGSVEKCLLEPTQKLFDIAKDKEVYYTFFVDVGYLIAADKYSELNSETTQVKNQIKEMIQLGHDVQLHIHPHWENAKWNGTWNMNINNSYKLSDFPSEEVESIIKRYKSYLDDLIGRKTFVFRAGGWCVQPFSLLKNTFKEVGVSIDTSVFPGAFLMTDNYYVDFTEAPLKSKYRFEDNVCKEVEKGDFIEYSISSYRYNPSFYWWLYGLGRIFPKKHKMLGDGIFISQGGRKLKSLTSFSNYHVSTDGYYAKKLEAALQKSANLNNQEMVVIGHPKSCTLYSLQKTKEFIEKNHKRHQFNIFRV